MTRINGFVKYETASIHNYLKEVVKRDRWPFSQIRNIECCSVSLWYTDHSNSQKETLRIVYSLIVANDLKYFQCEFWNILTSHRWSNNPIVLKEFTALSRVNENTSACKTIHFFWSLPYLYFYLLCQGLSLPFVLLEIYHAKGITSCHGELENYGTNLISNTPFILYRLKKQTMNMIWCET